MSIHTKSYPRAALIGNPSDGYHGKTIAFVFDNFCVDVLLEESHEMIFVPGPRDKFNYRNYGDLYKDIRNYGYYGGMRLLKATLKKFLDHCKGEKIIIPNKNFTISYESTIPQRLGLAGSSAIITAALKAITMFYGVVISKPIFANIVLATEVEELSISAGLQDRVAQAYELPVYMDFSKKVMDVQGYGNYETLSRDLFPNLYIALRKDLSEGSEVVHGDLRERFDSGNELVVCAMKKFGDITSEALSALKNQQPDRLSKMMNDNFDLRRSICDITPMNLEMVNLARSVGASAKFTGSGGAIIGIYKDESMYDQLTELCEKNKIEILKPTIVDGES